MPPMICAAPMARVSAGRLASPRMSVRQGFGPFFHAFASTLGWMSAITPSPMRIMAAKCFDRAELGRNIFGKKLFGGGFVVRCALASSRSDCGEGVWVESGHGICSRQLRLVYLQPGSVHG
jgi:hypothetical protein